ncbi:MAG: hypothetical protein IPK03_02415 [Bacteroidetes bacterium]|nr:hypothetical protein [Bacteroidota bacterium]
MLIPFVENDTDSQIRHDKHINNAAIDPLSGCGTLFYRLLSGGFAHSTLSGCPKLSDQKTTCQNWFNVLTHDDAKVMVSK